MVLKVKLAGGAVETLEEVIERVWMLQRIDGRKPVHPEGLDSQLTQAKHVLQAHPG